MSDVSAILVPVDGEVGRVTLKDAGDSNLRALQELLGGYCESLPYPAPGVSVMIHDEGKIIGLPTNRAATWMLRDIGLATWDYICGPAVLVGVDETGETVDCPLSVEEVKAQCNIYPQV